MAMDWSKQNTDTYNTSAKELSAYFRGIGSRIDDIECALKLAQKESGATVLEIGCGDGRDAAEIIQRVASYEGIDPSQGLLDIAKEKGLGGTFILDNAVDHTYPNQLDIIFAFASLLHVDKDDLYKVFHKAQDALRAGGIFYISVKEGDRYEERVQSDEYGERMFYYYNADIITTIAGDGFQTAYIEHRTIGSTQWLVIALKKNPTS
jgi:predicted TPR repeat methyltransferase